MSQHLLTEEEKARIGLLADAVVEVVAKRYSIEVADVQEAIRWYQHHKDFVTSIKKGGLLSLFGVLVTASLLALWEGIKAFARIKQ